MIRPNRSTRTMALAIALLMPLPTLALAPGLLLFVKQLVQDAVATMVRDTLLSGLAGMGCKGIALSNALAGLDPRGAAGVMGKLPAGGMPKLADMPPEMVAQMKAMMPGAGQLPADMALDPEMAAALARMQQTMHEPLSVPETLATIDTLFELGFLPAAVQSEFKQCMVLVPATIPALGMGMGLLKPMIPQLQQARAELHALGPAEQDEVAAALAQEMRALPAEQRAALLEHVESSFFPARIGEGVKARLVGR